MSLDRLEITPFAVIAGDILQNRRTGSLTIVRSPMRTVLYWSQGEVVLVTSSLPQHSLGEFLTARGVLTADRAAQLAAGDPAHVVAAFYETGLLDLSTRQTLLREWIHSLLIPLFSLDEGTAAFTEEQAIDPDKRVFLQSTAAIVVEGVRTISNGLVLRRSLGDLKREITLSRESRYSLDAIPLTDAERQMTSSLTDQQSIESFLKQYPNDSVAAAKVVITMLALGIYAIGEHAGRSSANVMSMDEMQRDLELLAAIGSSDQRSLRAVALSRQMSTLDHYQLLDLPRAAGRTQVVLAADAKKKTFDPATYPPIVRESIETILRRIDDAVNILKDPGKRAAYDKMLQQPGRGAGSGDSGIQQRLAQRSIAMQNFSRARDLSVTGDYYGAIVLLKQAVQFAPDMADAWYLLGSCQERNPKWRRDAAENFQMALSVDPNHVDAMISLGDLYKLEGLATRAQTCYEDALKIAPENAQASSRLAALKKR